MKNIEQFFEIKDAKSGNIVASMWVPVTKNIEPVWAEIKAYRMRYCGMEVRIVSA